jgi:hypothetical protein
MKARSFLWRAWAWIGSVEVGMRQTEASWARETFGNRRRVERLAEGDGDGRI